MILKLQHTLLPIFSRQTVQGRLRRALIAVAYTALLTLVLVQSSANPLIGPAAPREFNLAWEILLTLGHLIGFGLLVWVNWWALVPVAPFWRALLFAVLFACLLGLVTELLQSFVPDRSASLFDLACDCGIALLVGLFIHRRLR